MVFKDRTQEFNSVAESIRSKQLNAKTQWKTPKHQKSQFMLSASQIGKDIFETSEKLNKLTKLAKSDTLFENHTVEIEELTFIIKQDIQNLNRQIATLKEFANSKSSSNKQGEIHSKTVINYLNSKLADTTKGFKGILQVRTENLKVQQERRDRFTGGATSALGPATPPHARFAGANTASAATTEMSPSLAASPSISTNPSYSVSPTPHHVLRHRRPPHHSASYDGQSINSLPDSPMTSGGEVAISMPGMLLTQEYQ